MDSPPSAGIFSSVLLHLGVVALAFGLLRRLSVSRPVAGAIALLFAVHPVHTESIAWISGATDLILCVALLGSIWFVILLGEKMTPLRWPWPCFLDASVVIAWPFAATAIVYFIARQSILGTVQLSKSEVSLGETILTAPAVCANSRALGWMLTRSSCR